LGPIGVLLRIGECDRGQALICTVWCPPIRRRIRPWARSAFDPEAFHLDDVNTLLQSRFGRKRA